MGERGLEWNLPQTALSLVVEARLMLYLSTKGAELSPDVQNEAGGFPRRVRECFPRFQVSWRRYKLRPHRVADGSRQRCLSNRVRLLPSALSAWNHLLKAEAMAPSSCCSTTQLWVWLFYNTVMDLLHPHP